LLQIFVSWLLLSYPGYFINIYMQFLSPLSMCLLSNFIYLFIYCFVPFLILLFMCHCWFCNWPVGCWVSMLIRIEFIFDIVSIFTCNWQLDLWVSTQINKNLIEINIIIIIMIIIIIITTVTVFYGSTPYDLIWVKCAS